MCLPGLRTIGGVESGAPDAWIALDDRHAAALDGLSAGAHVVVVTWLDRSPDRPDPIGRHEAEIVEITDNLIHLRHLAVVDGTPVLGLEPVGPAR
jgi:tRNA (Thr-GGU) A37 N-methylase